jgi:hypothetical protein
MSNPEHVAMLGPILDEPEAQRCGPWCCALCAATLAASVLLMARATYEIDGARPGWPPHELPQRANAFPWTLAAGDARFVSASASITPTTTFPGASSPYRVSSP